MLFNTPFFVAVIKHSCVVGMFTTCHFKGLDLLVDVCSKHQRILHMILDATKGKCMEKRENIDCGFYA